MTRVFYRHLHHDYPVAVGGEGCHIVDRDGKRYLDASGGAAVSCLGHGHPEVIEAIKEQLDRIAYAHTGFFTSEPAEALAETLIAKAPEGMDRVYLVSGGSEAMEAAIKMARQYFLEKGEPRRRHFVARRQSYHGNTLGALAIGGNAWRREQFRPLLIDVDHLTPCNPYRERKDGESDEAMVARLVQEFDDHLQRLGPDTVCAFVAEPVVGATMGAVPALPGYFKGMREVCDRYGILMILDEVMCGMGRTGTWFACEQDGVRPDLVTVAKGLGAGYQPIGATLVSAPIVEAIHDGSGFFQHGHTYMAHPTACAAALAVQRVVEREDLLVNVREQGEVLADALQERFGNHAHIGDIRGRGLFRGLEFVRERSTKAPFPSAAGLAGKVKAEAMARGLICYPMGGTIDGKNGDHVLIAPPFIVNESLVHEMVETLGEAVDAALARALRDAA